jgi:hypothetical protein
MDVSMYPINRFTYVVEVRLGDFHQKMSLGILCTTSWSTCTLKNLVTVSNAVKTSHSAGRPNTANSMCQYRACVNSLMFSEGAQFP